MLADRARPVSGFPLGSAAREPLSCGHERAKKIPVLDRLHQLALKLRWTYPLLMLSGLAALGLSAWVALVSADNAEQTLLIPAVLAFGWCFLGLSFLNLFRSVPARLGPETKGFLQRLARQMHRGFLWLIAVAFIALTLALLLLSYKLLSTWLAA